MLPYYHIYGPSPSTTRAVFDLLITRTDDRTGLVHPPALFDDWTLETAGRFGGLTCLAADVRGFWFDKGDLVEDYSHLYRVAVPSAEVGALRDHV